MPVNIDRQRLQQVSQLELFAREVVEGFIVGMHKSPFHGFSVEFAEHRQYNRGDSTRHIDWKLYGRTDKLYLKKYEEETNLRARIVIDTSSSMYYPEKDALPGGGMNKLEFSVYSAAALIELLRKQRDAVGLSFFDQELWKHTETKTSMAHHRYLYDELESLIQSDVEQTGRTTAAVESLHHIAEDTHRRSLVFIFSDMMDSAPERQESVFDALQHLRHNKHEVVLFHVNHKSTEMDFDFENRPYRFIDPESGEELRIQPNEVREAYRESAESYYAELAQRCGQYRIDFVPSDITEGFNGVLTQYLIKRRILTR